MYELHFTGIEADKLLNTISVVGNNKADIIDFVVETVQHSISLAGYNCYIKVETKSGSYFNKEKLTVEERGDKLHCPWTLTWDYTQYKELQCQLQFQSDDGEEVVWQSRIFYLRLQNTLGVDGMISSKYPTILTQLEAEVATFDGRIHTLELRTPVTPVSDGLSIIDDLENPSPYQLYRYYDEMTEQPYDTLTILGERKALISAECIATKNGAQLNANTLPNYFDEDWPRIVDSIDNVTNCYTAYFKNSQDVVVCQAIRIGTNKNTGSLQLSLVESTEQVTVRVGKYFNFYDDEPHYDANSKVILNDDNYELPETGYIDIPVVIDDGILVIQNIDGRIHLYAIMTEGAEDELFEEDIPTTTWCHEYFYDKSEIDVKLTEKESVTNKVTAIDKDSTNTQYPSAKAVFNKTGQNWYYDDFFGDESQQQTYCIPFITRLQDVYLVDIDDDVESTDAAFVNVYYEYANRTMFFVNAQQYEFDGNVRATQFIHDWTISNVVTTSEQIDLSEIAEIQTLQLIRSVDWSEGGSITFPSRIAYIVFIPLNLTKSEVDYFTVDNAQHMLKCNALQEQGLLDLSFEIMLDNNIATVIVNAK